MPTGLKIPVGVSQSGGAAIEKNESKQLNKILILAFSEDDDENSFQDVGLFGGLIFSIPNAALRGRAERLLNNKLANFADRVLLEPGQPIRFEDLGDGDFEMSFDYIDLLTDKPETFSTRSSR